MVSTCGVRPDGPGSPGGLFQLVRAYSAVEWQGMGTSMPTVLRMRWTDSRTPARRSRFDGPVGGDEHVNATGVHPSGRRRKVVFAARLPPADPRRTGVGAPL